MIYKNKEFTGYSLDEFKQAFKEDVLRLGITRVRESRACTIQNFVTNWILNTEDEDGNII